MTTVLRPADVRAVMGTVAARAMRTPVFASSALRERYGGPVVLKAENLQHTGSFKLRGALAKLAALGERARAGVVVASAGNHAQAVAWAARAAGVACEVFMPADASVAKAEATEGYGATVRLEGETVADCLRLARARAEETGRELVHPFDDPAVIAGQGTVGLELLEQVPDLSAVVVPLGGGGLAAGVGVALAGRTPPVAVLGVQAEACAPFPSSLVAGRPLAVEPAPTLADGIAVPSPGEHTLPLVRDHVREVVTVSEDEIAEAMVLLLERAKLVVEGAGAVGVAALLAGALRPPAHGTTAVVLSGGNVDTNLLTPAIRRHETNAGRRLVLFARVSDRPGQLARLLACVGDSGANLVAVEHLREGFDLHVRETAVYLVLETRGHTHAARVLDAARAAGYEVEPAAPMASAPAPRGTRRGPRQRGGGRLP